MGGLSRDSVTALATVDAKADGGGDRGGRRGRAAGRCTATRPASSRPSRCPTRVRQRWPPSVPRAWPRRRPWSCGDELVVTKRKSAMATVALARVRPRGRLALVGLGPGDRDLVTPRAIDELRRASVVVGLDRYLDQIRDVLRPGTRVLGSGLGAEEQRARQRRGRSTQGARGRAGRLRRRGRLRDGQPGPGDRGRGHRRGRGAWGDRRAGGRRAARRTARPRPCGHVPVRPAHAVGGDRAPDPGGRGG